MNYQVQITNHRTQDVLYEQAFDCLDVGQVVIWLNTHKSLACPDVPANPILIAPKPTNEEDVPF